MDYSLDLLNERGIFARGNVIGIEQNVEGDHDSIMTPFQDPCSLNKCSNYSLGCDFPNIPLIDHSKGSTNMTCSLDRGKLSNIEIFGTKVMDQIDTKVNVRMRNGPR